MFERFDDGARHVVALAQDEARALGHPHVGTGHLLLGLLREPRGVAAAVLADAGHTPASVRAAVVRLVPGGQPAGDDAALLRAIGIDLDAVRASAEAAFGPGALDVSRRDCRVGGHGRRGRRAGFRRAPVRGALAFSPRSKKALEQSLRQALRLKDGHIGTGHLLLGLLAEGGGLAAEILSAGGVAMPELRRRTLAALGPTSWQDRVRRTR